ncbi:MAG: DsbA family protein [Solirubrobacteraceae bacterium]|nr:DsbA family protein [Solirubrobacteraceae bacterium]
MATVSVTHFTDPNCPFAYSAEPQLWRLKWRYGAQLEWTTRMVGLASSREEYAAKGLTPEIAAAGAAHLEAEVGMPFDLSVRDAVPATLPACREVVAARVHGGTAIADALLRQLRLEGMARGHVLDELHTLRNASHAAGIASEELDAWAKAPETEAALADDMRAARHPTAQALHLEHKLARWDGGWRYTCPSLELTAGDATAAIAGFVPATAYDVVFANLAPTLERAAPAEDPLAVLDWAGTPLATAEVAAIMETDKAGAREALTRAGASEDPLGTDALWSLPA